VPYVVGLSSKSTPQACQVGSCSMPWHIVYTPFCGIFTHFVSTVKLNEKLDNSKISENDKISETSFLEIYSSIQAPVLEVSFCYLGGISKMLYLGLD
jgi:hypothetical protein